MNKLTFFILILFYFNPFLTLHAAVTNDVCADATPITLGKVCNGFSPNVDNTGAVDEGTVNNPSCFDTFNDVNDIWFSFTAPANGKVSIFADDFSGSLSSLDMVLYSGTCANLSEVTGTCTSYQGVLKNISVTPNDTYYLRISGIGEEGNFCLEVIEPPANDICSNSTTLSIGNNCTAASPNGTNFSANDEGNAGSCFETGGGFTPINDVWFDFVAPSGGNVHINVLPETDDFTTYEVAVYSGTCGSLTQVNCTFGQPAIINNLSVTAGATYYIQVNGQFEQSGNFCIKVFEPLPNDECTGAIALTTGSFCTGSNTNGDNTGAVDEGTVPKGDCMTDNPNDIWFSFVPAGSGWTTISTDFTGGTLTDTDISLFSGTCGSLTEIACDADGGVDVSFNSILKDQILVSGQTYYIRVAGYDGAEGSFCIEVTEKDCSDDFDIDSQAKLAALANLTCTTLDGALSFSGNDVTDLSSLSTITEITGNLTIHNCDMLTTLEGLDNLGTIGGNLTIRFSDNLATCCAVFPVIDQGGIVGSTSIFSNATGCTTVNDILADCTPVCEHLEQDSLALIALYNATDGPNWKNKWDLTKPMSTWHGVTLDFALCVTGLNLSDNGLEGSIPNLDLPLLETLNLYNNQIDACAELTQLPALNSLDLRFNALSFDDLLVNKDKAATSFLYGGQTLCNETIEVIVDINDDWNVDLGFDDTVSTNKYQWKKEFGSPIGDTLTTNTFSISAIQESDVGEYYCIIINPNLPDLTLQSCIYNLRGNCTTRSTDSLALIALYSATNGPSWQNKWDLSKPMHTWYGVTATDIGCVTSLSLYNNKLAGTLPNLNMSQLTELYLGSNSLQGNIPDLTTPKLTTLYLSNNNFTTCSEFTNLSELQYLDLSSNAFTFEDLLVNQDKAASSFSYSNQVVCQDTILVDLEQGADWAVDLNIDDDVTTNKYQWKKGFSKVGDTLLTNMFTLENVSESDAGFYTATIVNPNLPSLLLFSCKYNLKVSCSNRATDSLSLVQLYNATDGPNWKIKWDLSKPMHTWHGVEATPEGCVVTLNLSSNHLKGTLPDLNLQNLLSLNLNHDTLSGNIPDFSNMPNLKFLYLGDNQLSGNIPNFSNLPDLVDLSIWGNQLDGTLPDFSNLDNLETLWLSKNQLTGTIPNFNDLTKLDYLSLSNNQLEGTLPDFTHLTTLAHLGVSSNKLEGEVSNINNPELTYLGLSYNNFSGSIPNFSHIHELVYLYLSGNNFTGTVPNFSKLPNLEYLGLRSLKQLELPGFTSLPNLVQLDVKFSGFSFDDILPNLTVPSDTFLVGTQTIYCEINPIVINAELGSTITLDLMVDDTVTSNVYQWYKNDVLIENTPNANILEITNFQVNNSGTYKAVISNPNAPHGSIVNSCKYQVALALANDDVCDATLLTLGQASSGSFLGATVQENEPYAPGKNCEVNWCDSTLNGSVWYKFVAPATEGVNIEISSPTEHSDTKIALYADVNCNLENPFQNALLLDANDDKPGNCCDGSIIALACLNPGETYYIQVDQYEAGQDDFNITVNALESCELSCDLMIGGITVKPDSCIGEGGSIFAKINSPTGQLFMTELLDETGNPVDTGNSHGASFGHIDEGLYRIRVTSLETENCSVESELIEVVATCEEGCSPNLNIEIIEKELYHAQETIISTATLAEGHVTTFKAGTSITLKAGFHAQGTFTAIIEDCAANLLEEPVTKTLAKLTIEESVDISTDINMKIFPNPFNYSTTIAYQLPIEGEVNIQVFDFMGKQISVLAQGVVKEKGLHQVEFQANQLTNGTYFVVLQSGTYYETQKMIILRE